VLPVIHHLYFLPDVSRALRLLTAVCKSCSLSLAPHEHVSVSQKTQHHCPSALLQRVWHETQGMEGGVEGAGLLWQQGEAIRWCSLLSGPARLLLRLLHRAARKFCLQDCRLLLLSLRNQYSMKKKKWQRETH